MANQYRTVGTHWLWGSALGVSLPLFGLGAVVVGCGGRSLDPDGLAGNGGAGHLGPTNATNDGSTDNGNGNGNGNNGNGNNGNGNNGNGNNGNGNNGNGNGVTTAGSPATAQAVSAVTVTSTDGGTTGSAVPGSCQAPYNLNDWGETFSGVTSYFSAFIGECNGDGSGPELFFTWEAPRSAGYRLHTTGSSIDTVLYRLNGDPCDGRVVDCNDDANGFSTSELLFSAERGQQMTFVLDSYYAAGAVQLTIDETDLPPCGPSYGELSGLGQLVNQVLPLDETTLGDPTTDACEGAAPRIKFDWTAPHDGSFTFDTVGSNYDTVLVVRTICDIISGERCNDDEFGVQSGVVQSANEGQILRIEIAAFSGNAVPSTGDQPIVVLNVR